MRETQDRVVLFTFTLCICLKERKERKKREILFIYIYIYILYINLYTLFTIEIFYAIAIDFTIV